MGWDASNPCILKILINCFWFFVSKKKKKGEGGRKKNLKLEKEFEPYTFSLNIHSWEADRLRAFLIFILRTPFLSLLLRPLLFFGYCCGGGGQGLLLISR